MTRLTMLLLLVAGGLRASATPELTLYAPAKTSFPTLGVPVGVKAVGMGEAYTAAGGDVYSLHWNPAGLARMSGFQLGLAHNEWSSALGLRQEFLTYGQGLGQNAGFAVSANYFTLGKLEQRSLSGALTGESTAFAFSGTAGYAMGLLDQGRLKLGLSAEFGMESLFSASQSNVGGTVGMIYDFNRSFNMALSVNHLGTGAGGFMPPSAASFGMSGVMLNRKMLLALDASLPFNADPTIRLGTELNFGTLAVRGGYRYAVGAKNGDVQSGPTAGAGFKMGLFDIDYAFVPYGELSTTHRVSATLALPADFFKPKVIGADRSTATAKSFYEAAVSKEKSGALIQAMIEYQKVVDSYPLEKLNKAKNEKPHVFYVTAVRKARELQAEISKGGQSEGVRKEIQRNLTQGQEYYAARRYKEAIRAAKDVLTLDEGNAVALKLRKDAEAGLTSRKANLIAEGKSQHRAGNTSKAIMAWREVLKIDSDDQQATDFFRNNRSEIEGFLKKVHRRGIDAYVAGRIKEAVDIWEQGKSLDPSDPLKMSRDIDKAKKLLDLKSQR